MWIFIAVIVMAFAAFALRRHLSARRLRRIRPVFQDGLAALIRATRRWPKSEYELVDYDTDRYPEMKRFWRTVTLRPEPDTCWRIQIEPKRGYRLEWRVGEKPAAHFPGELAWSKEPWIKEAFDRLLAAIAALPAPRTFEEFLRKRQEEHAAYMAELDAERAAWERHRETRGSFPSLDDPLDDMD